MMKNIRPIIALVLFICIITLPLVANRYWIDVCVSIGIYAWLALSLNVILGQAGLFHMGHAAFFAIGAYTTAVLNTQFAIPILYTMPLAGILAGVFALIVARPIIHLRGDYLLIVTIGIVEIVRLTLINDVGGYFGGSNGIFGISRPELFGMRIVTPAQFYYFVWGGVGLSVLFFTWLAQSRFGRALNYIRDDDVAANACGINVAGYKLMAFIIGACWAGTAGTVFAAKMTIVTPESFSFTESVVLFAVVILSGGSQLGVLISTFIFIGLPELLREFSQARMLIFGLAMMIMMVWRPQGLLPPSLYKYKLNFFTKEGKLKASAEEIDKQANYSPMTDVSVSISKNAGGQ